MAMFLGWTAAMSSILFVDFTRWDQGQKMAQENKSEEGQEALEASLLGLSFSF